MRVTIHQPEHLPWLGLLAKVQAADVWIVLDQVAYRKNYFQNRNRLLLDRQPTWLTVPVKPKSGTPINEVVVGTDPSWQRKYIGRMAQALPAAAHDGRLDPLTELLDGMRPGDRLMALNLAVSDWLMREFGMGTPRILGSELKGAGAKSDLILSLCRNAGATTYLAGPSGRDYLDRASFADAGIEIEFFDFDHPRYDQHNEPFIPGMSALEPYGLLQRAELPQLLSTYRLATT